MIVGQLKTSGDMVLGIWERTDLAYLNNTNRVLLVELDEEVNCVDYFLIVNIWLVGGYLYLEFWDSSLGDYSMTTDDLVCNDY